MNREEKFLKFVEVLEDGTILDKEGNELKTYKSEGGYIHVMLPGLGFISVHKLVAAKYLEKTGFNPDGTPIVGKYQVNHKDKDKTNNKRENLEWCDSSYNLRYSGIRKNREDLSKPVLAYDTKSGNYHVYPSLREAARSSGVNASTLHYSIHNSRLFYGIYLRYLGNDTEEEALEKAKLYCSNL